MRLTRTLEAHSGSGKVPLVVQFQGSEFHPLAQPFSLLGLGRFCVFAPAGFGIGSGAGKRSNVQPQAGELGSHDYLKRRVAYLVRRVYNCAQGNTSLEPKSLAQPWKGLGRFCRH
jgi:hypothetical protein